MQRIAANLRRTTVVGEHGVVAGEPSAWVPSLLQPVALCHAQRSPSATGSAPDACSELEAARPADTSKAATAGESGDESMWMSARSMFSTSRSLLSASSTWRFVSAIDASDEGGRPTVSGARLRCFGSADGDGGFSFGSRGTRWLPRTTVGMGVLPLAEPILEPFSSSCFSVFIRRFRGSPARRWGRSRRSRGGSATKEGEGRARALCASSRATRAAPTPASASAACSSARCAEPSEPLIGRGQARALIYNIRALR